MSNEADYRIYIAKVTNYFYPHNVMTIWVKVYKTKKAIADKVHFPGPAKARKYMTCFSASVNNHEEVTLYWNGKELISKAEYDFKLDCLQKHWLKVQAERDKKATVEDVLRFINANSNGRPDTKAGQNTSEGRESIDRCEGVTQ
jgi:hypothetical protein